MIAKDAPFFHLIENLKSGSVPSTKDEVYIRGNVWLTQWEAEEKEGLNDFRQRIKGVIPEDEVGETVKKKRERWENNKKYEKEPVIAILRTGNEERNVMEVYSENFRLGGERDTLKTNHLRRGMANDILKEDPFNSLKIKDPTWKLESKGFKRIKESLTRVVYHRTGGDHKAKLEAPPGGKRVYRGKF